jgi:putative DNA-invertase from lambdoid prophage Rac
LASKLDRIGRDAIDVAAMLKMLAQRKIEVIVLQLGWLDLTSPGARLLLKMLFAVAETERDLLVERTRDGLVWAKAGVKTLRRTPTTTEQQKL